MRIKVKGRKFLTEHIWFEQFKTRSEIVSDVDKVCVHANKEPIIKSAVKQNSLITDLNGEVEDIFNSFNATVRNEVRRAEREGVECEYYTSSDLKDNREVLDSFAEMYNEMYREKGISCVLELNSIDAYIKKDCFLLTTAILDGKPCVYHSYIVGDGKARLLHSCSEFRVVDKNTKNSIGRANRLLHFQDMNYLKNEGITEYDWGGITSFDQPNGIDKFKIGFGGVPVSYYNFVIDLTFMAKIGSIYKKLFKK